MRPRFEVLEDAITYWMGRKEKIKKEEVRKSLEGLRRGEKEVKVEGFRKG